jgi:hypothetical protein
MSTRQIGPLRPRRTDERVHPDHSPTEEKPMERASDQDVINDIDELLDEIDAVLEEQSVLVDFRQRSGQ